MDDLMSQFTLLSDQALVDKSFDPSTIEALLHLMDLEAERSWSALESECHQAEQDALNAMAEAEAELEAAMDDAMDEFARFHADMQREAMAEYRGLDKVGDVAWRMGQVWERSATAASSKYIEAANKSADESVKAANKGIKSSKVHPS